jgi:hypothetical protein
VLRAHVPRSGRWVAMTALGWAAGLAAFTAISTPLWAPGQPVLLTAAIGIAAGAAMAATVAAVTGVGLSRLLEEGAAES